MAVLTTRVHCVTRLQRRIVAYVIIHKQNEGINAMRRRGVKETKGEWVMFVEDDDSLVDGALE